jgi:hypothetical protein
MPSKAWTIFSGPGFWDADIFRGHHVSFAHRLRLMGSLALNI